MNYTDGWEENADAPPRAKWDSVKVWRLHSRENTASEGGAGRGGGARGETTGSPSNPAAGRVAIQPVTPASAAAAVPRSGRKKKKPQAWR